MLLQLGVNFSIFFGESRDTVAQIGNAIFDQRRHLIKKKTIFFDKMFPFFLSFKFELLVWFFRW